MNSQRPLPDAIKFCWADPSIPDQTFPYEDLIVNIAKMLTIDGTVSPHIALIAANQTSILLSRAVSFTLNEIEHDEAIDPPPTKFHY